MSVYESFKNSRPAVIGVRALLSGTSSVGIEVGVVDNRKDYFLSAEDKHTRVDIEGISLRGSFAQITVQDKEICSFYLGSGFCWRRMVVELRCWEIIPFMQLCIGRRMKSVVLLLEGLD